MSLIPEANDIKAVLRSADLMAGKVAEEMVALKNPTSEEIVPLLCTYIGYKYLLPGEIYATETLEEAGKRSLETVKRKGNTVPGMDVLPHCGSASSATHKKILLQMALSRELAIDLPPRECTECETIDQLAALVSRQLSGRKKER